MTYKVKLGLVSDIIMGQSPPGKTYNRSANGTPLLNGPTEFGEFHPTPKTWTTAATKVCKAGDLLFCVRGSSVGRMNWADREYCLGRGLCAIRGKGEDSSIDTRFIYYSIVTSLPNLLNLSHGTVFPDISKEDISNFEIKWYDDNTRAQISNMLSTIDDKIKINGMINSTLEQIMQTLFKSWFIDFEFPNEEGKPYKSSDGKMIDSELGKIPMGWKVSSLADAFDINPIRNLSKGSMAPYVEMANMPNSYARIINFIDRKYTSGSKFMNGDTLVARITPCLENGKTAIVDFLNDGTVGWGSTEFIVFRPKTPIPTEYAYFLARTERFRLYAISNMSGTSGRQRVPVDCFNNFKVVIPEIRTVSSFESLTKPSFRLMRLRDNESAILAKLREILRPLLISGKIRINVDKILKEINQ